MASISLAQERASGIYRIRNLANGKCYVGSAKEFSKRWNGHRAHLRKGTHHSRYLQSSWNKHGEEGFSFEVVELCAVELLLVREQHWLDAEKPAYNVCKHAGNTLGRMFSEEAKAKIGAGNKGRKHKPRSAEYRAKISAIHKGRVLPDAHMAALQAGRARQVFTDERRAKVSAALRTGYADGTRSRERSQEYRDKIANTLRGRTLSPELREKVRISSTGRRYPNRKRPSGDALERVREANRKAAQKRVGIKRRPEVVAAMSSRMKGRKLPDAHLAILSIARKAMWANPEYKEKMRSIHKARWAAKKRISNDQPHQPDLQGL